MGNRMAKVQKVIKLLQAQTINKILSSYSLVSVKHLALITQLVTLSIKIKPMLSKNIQKTIVKYQEGLVRKLNI